MWQRLGMKRIPEKGEYVNLERNLRDTGGFVESSIKERVYYCPVGWPGHVEDDYEGNVGEELGRLMHANTLVRDIKQFQISLHVLILFNHY